MHARLDRGAVRLLTRTGLDWTAKYPTIAASIASLPARQAYLDGELCGVRPDGTTSFSLIQNASDTGNSGALVFFLFDLIHQNGEAIGPLPLAERKERLRVLLSGAGSPLLAISAALMAHLRRGTGRRLNCLPTAGWHHAASALSVPLAVVSL
jgi:ATP-dependent DNA ligase